MIWQPCRVHSTCNIDRVSPDVVLRLSGPDDTGDDGPDVDPDPDHEVVVRVVVDVLQLLAHAEHVLDQLPMYKRNKDVKLEIISYLACLTRLIYTVS